MKKDNPMRKFLSLFVMFLLCQYSTRVLAANIQFADANVKAICIANWDTNGDGELSEAEAAAVKSLGTVFKENQTITSFNELQYFTGLTSIGESAFEFCTNLTSITIPESVTSIEVYAFCLCSGLTSITIPENVTNISPEALGGCHALTSIKVETGNTKYDSRNNCNAIIETATNTLIASCQNTVIPDNVTKIGPNSFWGCEGLTSITIPNSVTIIAEYAFYSSYLTSITIPSSVTSIGEWALGACRNLTSIKVETGNTKYDSRNNCNAIIETATNTLIAGCQNTVIPNNVTKIGRHSFFGSGLTSITIPNSVTSIKFGAFGNCYGLTSITIPGSVTSIENYAFADCKSLKNITSYIEKPFAIDNGVFEYVPYETATLYVPTGTMNAYRTTNGWKNFQNIELINSQDSQAIDFADANVKALCVAKWDTNGDGELSYDEAAAVTNLGTVFKNNEEITSFNELQYFTGLTSIASSAFYICSNLTSITIPGSVTSIESRAFYHCNKLTSITIPEGVTNINANALAECDGLTSIKVETGNTTYDSRNDCNAIIKTSNNTLITGCKNTVIPNSVTSLGAYAFRYCVSLTSITIPESVTNISQNAFNGCSALTSISVETGNTTYDSRNDCNAIIKTATNTLIAGCKNTVIPNSVTSIGSYAFDSCSGLTSITIPGSVTGIERYAFSDCSALTNITSYIEEPFAIDNNVFQGIPYETATLFVPAGTIDAYKATDGWKDFPNIVAMGIDGSSPIDFADANVKALCVANWDTNGDGELSYDEAAAVTDLGTVFKSNRTIASFNELQYFTGLTSIGEDAFAHCRSLTSVTIPNSVTCIGKYAFFDCIGLSSVTIGNGVTSIGYDAFYSCSSLTSITIPNSVTSISREAFGDCSRLSSITVAEANTTYDSRNNCNAIIETATNTLIAGCQNTIIPGSVTSIGDEAFLLCSSLTSITIPESVANISQDAFYLCTGLTSIEVAAGNLTYDSRNNCNAIIETATNTLKIGCQSTIIPGSVTSIGNYAFRYCFELTSITIPESVTSIGHEPFADCRGLISIEVAAGNLTYDSRNNCNAIIETATNTLVAGCQNTIIPGGVTSIGWGAFSGCRGLTSITIPEGLTSIGDWVFEGCSGLTSIVIPGGVTSIGHHAFTSCSGLTSITIPESVTSIGYSAFSNTAWYNNKPNGMVYAGKVAYMYKGTMPENAEIVLDEGTLGIAGWAFDNCSSLTSITIPGSVTNIGGYAFEDCSSLTEVYCYAEQVPSAMSAFNKTSIKDATLYVPKGSVESYKATSPWNEFGKIEKIPSEANPDVNNNGSVDVGDIMTIINYIADDIYNAEVDLNDDGFVDIGDIMVVINVIIKPQDNSAGVKALRDMTDTEPVTENNDYLSITNEDNIVSIQLDNEFEYSAFQMLVTLPDGVDVNAVMFNSERLDGFTKFVKKVNEQQYIIIGFSMNGNVIAGSTGKILSLSTTGNADDNIIISEPIFSIPEAKTYKLRVDDSNTTDLQDIQLSQFSVRGNTLYVHANNDTTLNIYAVSGALCEQKHLHPGVNAITLRRGQYIINNHKVTISK